MTDTTTNNDQTPKKRVLSPREEAMEAIGRTRNDEFTKETGIAIVATDPTDIVVDPDTDPEAAAAEAERARLLALAGGKDDEGGDDEQIRLQREQEAAATAREEEAARTAEAATQRAQAAAGIDPQGKYKFKVNGQETELSGTDVLRIVQKDVSADARLEQASQTLREAQELQRSLQAQQEAAAEADAAKAKGGNPDGVVVDPTITKKFTSSLFAGDEATATQAFQEAVSGAVKAAMDSQKGRGDAATPVNPNAIAAQVRQQIAIDSALERNRQDYPGIYADPDVESVAAAKIERKVKEGVPFITALEEETAALASKLGIKKHGSGAPAPVRTDRREEKLRQKESLDQVPSATQAKSTTLVEPVATVHDTIREMAKQRGQAL